MNRKLKSEKGAITMIVLVSVLFIMAFLISLYIRVANKAQASAETTKQIAQKYNNLDELNSIYEKVEDKVIPIKTREQLEKIGSGEQVLIDGKIYTYSSDGYYTLVNDIDLGRI